MPPVAWLTDLDLTRQLEQAVSVQWNRHPLRDAITSLSRTQRVAMLLDRRIDPDQLVTFAAEQQPLATVLDQFAASFQAGVSQVGSVMYIGPRPTAEKLRTLSALAQVQVSQLSASARGPWQKIAAWRWKFLAQPRQLLADLAQEARVTLADVETAVPHDLWAEADLPPLAWYDRTLLVLVQFDRTIEIRDGGKQLALVEIPARVQIERSYPTGKNAEETLAKFRELAPAAECEVKAGKISVRGRVEDHARLTPQAASKSPPNKTPPKPGIDVYSLTLTEVPLNKVLEALSERLGLKFEFDREQLQRAGIKLDQRVSLKVEQQPLEALLRAALEPAGLAFRLQGKTVEIVVPSKKP
ncbi:MAG: hypothetical protein JNM18_04220 [Planctomycetaceae bacterium]|nr:hypothetical protein [Planctomycetaceae bacterium]